jgi:Protein of unknown function (DUF3618)
MAEDPHEVKPDAVRDRTPAEIRQDIQRTRAEIDQTLDTLGRELQPKRMLWHARQEIEPEVRAAAGRLKENPKPLIAAGAAIAGLFALRALGKRRKKKRAQGK